MIKIKQSDVTARCDWCGEEDSFHAVKDPCNPWLILRGLGWAKVQTRAGDTIMCPSCNKDHQSSRIKQYLSPVAGAEKVA